MLLKKRFKRRGSVLALALSLASTLLFPINVKAAGYNIVASEPSSSAYDLVGSVDKWFEASSAQDAVGKVASQMPGADTYYVESVTTTCMHYFDYDLSNSLKEKNAFYGDDKYLGWTTNGIAYVKPNGTFVLRAEWSADGQSHTFRAGSHQYGYTIWAFFYRACIEVNGTVQDVDCQGCGDKLDKIIPGGALFGHRSWDSVQADDVWTRMNYGTTTTGNGVTLNWQNSAYGEGLGLHGGNKCWCHRDQYPLFFQVDGSPTLSDGTSHVGTFYKVKGYKAKTYDVVYDANKPSSASGSVAGAMANTTTFKDVWFNLPANGYSLSGWQFTGWNTSPNGLGTSYSNQQSVVNLASPGGSITLYAQWKPINYEVRVYPNKPSDSTTSIVNIK